MGQKKAAFHKEVFRTTNNNASPEEKEAATRIEAAFKGRKSRSDLHEKIMREGTEEQKAALLDLEQRRARREAARVKKEKKRSKKAKQNSEKSGSKKKKRSKSGMKKNKKKSEKKKKSRQKSTSGDNSGERYAEWG